MPGPWATNIAANRKLANPADPSLIRPARVGDIAASWKGGIPADLPPRVVLAAKTRVTLRATINQSYGPIGGLRCGPYRSEAR